MFIILKPKGKTDKEFFDEVKKALNEPVLFDPSKRVEGNSRADHSISPKADKEDQLNNPGN